MKTVLIDGNNSLWRLAAKMPILTTSDGTQVQLVYGFFRLLHGCLIDFEPNNVLVLWDCGRPRLRINLFNDYKRHRREKRERPTTEEKAKFAEVMVQMEMIKDVLPFLSVCQYEVKDTEADDLISIACHCLHGKKIVVSGDKDMLQLVNKEVKVFLPLGKTRELYDYKNFERKVGLTPRQFLDVKILSGDHGDGVPGIAKGFGEGSARKLIQKFGSIEELWTPTARHEIKRMGKRFQLIYSEDAKYAVERNRLLVDLTTFHSKYAATLIKVRVKHNPRLDELKVRSYFRDHEFRSLLKDFHSWIVPFKQLGGRK